MRPRFAQQNPGFIACMTRHPRSFWADLVSALERGADLHVTAARHGVKATTLQWWRTEIRRQRRLGLEFLPVVVRTAPATAGEPPRSSSGRVEIAIGAVVVRAEIGCDVGYLAALAQALSSAC